MPGFWFFNTLPSLSNCQNSEQTVVILNPTVLDLLLNNPAADPQTSQMRAGEGANQET